LRTKLSIKFSSLKWVAIISLLILAAFLYVFVFIDILENEETVGYGFQAIVQSDTMLFRDIFKNFNVGLYLDANVKNTIIPVYMWTFINGNWFVSVVINVLFLIGFVYFMNKISIQIENILSVKRMLFIVLIPETFIYLIGILKEIPTLFFFTATTYFFISRKWFKFLIFFLLLILFRYQFALCFALFIGGNLVFGRNNIRFLFLLFIFLSATYPFWVSNLQILGQEDAKLYREMGEGLGIGGIVESIQSNIYGLSILATVVKFFQMMVEPWPALNIIDNNGINLIATAYSISAVIWLSIWFKYFNNVFIVLKQPSILTQSQNLLLCISFTFLLMVSFNSFVHHRYLYPGMGLILIFASIVIPPKKEFKN
jgi:hypothetical protein